MTDMKVVNQDFYEKVGDVLYAIAADQHLKPLEVPELKLFISKNCQLSAEKPSVSKVSESAHFVLTAIDNLQGAGTSASEAYRQFQEFYLDHPEFFTNERKQQIMDLASGITRIFAVDHAFENYHLIELKALLFSHVFHKSSLPAG
jgi:hypothetical protein